MAFKHPTWQYCYNIQHKSSNTPRDTMFTTPPAPPPPKKIEHTTLLHIKISFRWWIFYFENHHHHHVVPPARISLTLSHHFSLSFIASGRSSGLHPVSSHSCCMYVRAGRPAFARPLLMSSSLLLQQCPACLVRLTWIIFVMGGRWPYSWCFVGCCRQDLFNIARNILV